MTKNISHLKLAKMLPFSRDTPIFWRGNLNFMFVFWCNSTILVWKFFMDEFLFNCRSKQLQTGPSHLANVVAWVACNSCHYIRTVLWYCDFWKQNIVFEKPKRRSISFWILETCIFYLFWHQKLIWEEKTKFLHFLKK